MREVVGDPQPTIEACRNFLEDVHSTHDLYVQECTRTENQLFAAQQTITALTTQLHIANERLSTIEDLVGEVRTRMQSHGLATHPTVQHAFRKPILSANVTNNKPSCEFLGPSVSIQADM